MKKEWRNKSSLRNLTKGGKPIFNKKSNKKNKYPSLEKDAKLLLKSIERWWLSSYIKVTIKKIKYEIKPWPTIIIMTEKILSELPKRHKQKIGPIWTIEEQATKYFKSKNRDIIERRISILQETKTKLKFLTILEILEKKWKNLNNPIEPIFNISLAKIMDPHPDALTWALVNQKWNKNKGSFLTKSPKKHIKTNDLEDSFKR